jgi:transposase InsO family protein
VLATQAGRGLLLYSDRASQYVNRTYRRPAADFKAIISTRRRANAWDHAPTENFFKTQKVERLYQANYERRALARLVIVDWIEGYRTRQRLHASIDSHTHLDYEAGLTCLAARGNEAGSPKHRQPIHPHSCATNRDQPPPARQSRERVNERA